MGSRRQAPFKKSYQDLSTFAQRMRLDMTPAEMALWAGVNRVGRKNPLGVRVRRQCVVHGYIADFYIHKWRLVIEVDGSFHDDRYAHDQRRDDWLIANGYTVLRFSNAEVLTSLDDVIKRIIAAAPIKD